MEAIGVLLKIMLLFYTVMLQILQCSEVCELSRSSVSKEISKISVRTGASANLTPQSIQPQILPCCKLRQRCTSVHRPNASQRLLCEAGWCALLFVVVFSYPVPLRHNAGAGAQQLKAMAVTRAGRRCRKQPAARRHGDEEGGSKQGKGRCSLGCFEDSVDICSEEY